MQLDDYLIGKRLTGAAFGRMIGVARSTVHRYRHRERMPRPAELSLIQRVTLDQVTPNDFMEGLRKNGRRSKRR